MSNHDEVPEGESGRDRPESGSRGSDAEANARLERLRGCTKR